VATKYRMAYAVNGVFSDWSEPSLPVYSITQTDPILTVKAPQAGASVIWQRAVGPGFASWNNHQMKMVSAAGANLDFLDDDNVCNTPFKPDPPPAPVPGGGAFGDGMWAAIAGEGIVPWCEPATDRARYVKNGQESLFSPSSAPFQSDIYTNPSMTVPILQGYEIQWIRNPYSCLITLPSYQTVPGGVFYCRFVFTFLSGFQTRFAKEMDLSPIWDESSPTLTMSLDTFVQLWNGIPPSIGSTPPRHTCRRSSLPTAGTS
jgi:hypothetical protein